MTKTILILIVILILGFKLMGVLVYTSQLKALIKITTETDLSCEIGDGIGLKCEKIYETNQTITSH